MTALSRTLLLLASLALARIALSFSWLFLHVPSSAAIQDDSVPVIDRALDDGSRPRTDEVVSLSSNVRRDMSAFCVEQDDASETGLLEVSTKSDGEEFALDIENREWSIREGLESTPGTFEEVIFDGLGQRGSGRVV